MGVEASDLFLASAEIAVAFIGFASLVGVFLFRSGGALPARERILLWSLVDYGLVALGGCAIPLVLGAASEAEPLAWDLVSGIQLALCLVYLVLSRQAYREAIASLPNESGPGGWILIGGDFLSYLALVANMIGWPAWRAFLTQGAAARWGALRLPEFHWACAGGAPSSSRFGV